MVPEVEEAAAARSATELAMDFNWTHVNEIVKTSSEICVQIEFIYQKLAFS